MKFLVRGESVDNAGPRSPQEFVQFLEQVILPSFRQIQRAQQQGKILFTGAPAGERTGLFVLEAGSAEEVHQFLTSLPFWPLNRWDVTALVDIDTGINTIEQQIQRLRSMGGGV